MMNVRRMAGAFAVGAGLLALAPTASAQNIADRVDEVEDGKVRMSFAARPGVCGNGEGSISLHGGDWTMHRGRSGDWEWECEPGPVRVVLHVRDGDVREIDTYVAGRWRPATSSTLDLGTVPAPQAAGYLLELARRSRSRAGKGAILPAMLADGVTVWPELLDMARDGGLPGDTRKAAVFWLGQEASEAATEGLDRLVGDDSADREIREMAIFALSQRPRDEGVPALIRLVRTGEDPELIRKALFWLGQSEDPRAIALFEEILTGG